MLGSDWAKAKRSFSNSNCVEARRHGGGVQIRDSKNPGPVIATSEESWAEFLAGLPVAARPVPAWPPPERRVRGLIAPDLDRPR